MALIALCEDNSDYTLFGKAIEAILELGDQLARDELKDASISIVEGITEVGLICMKTPYDNMSAWRITDTLDTLGMLGASARDGKTRQAAREALRGLGKLGVAACEWEPNVHLGPVVSIQVERIVVPVLDDEDTALAAIDALTEVGVAGVRFRATSVPERVVDVMANIWTRAGALEGGSADQVHAMLVWPLATAVGDVGSEIVKQLHRPEAEVQAELAIALLRRIGEQEGRLRRENCQPTAAELLNAIGLKAIEGANENIAISAVRAVSGCQLAALALREASADVRRYGFDYVQRDPIMYLKDLGVAAVRAGMSGATEEAIAGLYGAGMTMQKPPHRLDWIDDVVEGLRAIGLDGSAKALPSARDHAMEHARAFSTLSTTNDSPAEEQ